MSPSPFHLTSRESSAAHLYSSLLCRTCSSSCLISLANPTIILWAGCCAHLLISSLPRLPAHHPLCCPFHNAGLSLCSHILDLFALFALSLSIPFPLNLFFLFGLLLPSAVDKLCMFFPSNLFLLISHLLLIFFLSQCVLDTFLLQGPFLIPLPFAPLPRIHHGA